MHPGPGGDPRAGQGVQVRALPQLCHHRPLQPEEDPLILALDSPMERIDICIYHTTFTVRYVSTSQRPSLILEIRINFII